MQHLIDQMVRDGLDYIEVTPSMLIGEYDGEYWLVDCSGEVDMREMPKIMRLR